MKQAVIILDMDNCIANDAWRIPFIDWANPDPDARYHAYHAMAYYDDNDLDRVENVVREWSEKWQRLVRVFVLTARSLRYRTLTELWLKEHATFAVEAIMMRNIGDARHSPELKMGQLKDLLMHHDVRVEDIVYATDDRHEVLDMYVSMGVQPIAIAHHAIHNVCAYTNPNTRTQPALTVPEILRGAAETYEVRNKAYGNNYKHFGHTMLGVFPDGLTVNTHEEWTRLALLMHCADKMTRFGKSFRAGGHADSAHDLSVYAAMLQELTQ